MKFDFESSSSPKETKFKNIVIEKFRGPGPFIINGRRFDESENWFFYAQRVSRALGIEDAECSILPADGDTKGFMFAFSNPKDYRTFIIALKGEQFGKQEHNFAFESRKEMENTIRLMHNFAERYEIDAQFEIISDKDFRVKLVSQMDLFQIISAYESGKFGLHSTHTTASPNPPENN
jgi:hypothetical protein